MTTHRTLESRDRREIRARAVSFGNAEGGGNPLVSQVQQELATAYAQEFFSTVRDKCFQKCITKPGSSLSSGDQNCLARCCDRYIDATKVVSQSVLQTAQSGAQ